jgi:hypothetical protein
LSSNNFCGDVEVFSTGIFGIFINFSFHVVFGILVGNDLMILERLVLSIFSVSIVGVTLVGVTEVALLFISSDNFFGSLYIIHLNSKALLIISLIIGLSLNISALIHITEANSGVNVLAILHDI